MIIRLTDKDDGSVLLINIAHVTSIHKDDEDTIVNLVDESYYTVEESINTIEAMLSTRKE